MTRHSKGGRDPTRSGSESEPTSGDSTPRLDTGSVDGTFGPRSPDAIESRSSDTLEHVRRTETVADRVDFESLRRELPPEWSVRPDLVQFGAEPLAETVLFRRAIAGPQIVLKPVDPADPAGEIDFYERGDPRASRERTMTVGPLSDALRVAVNRIHQLDD